MKHVRYFLIPFLFSLFSCVKVIDLEHLRPEPKLVLNSLVMEGEPVTATISRTWFYTDKERDVMIKDAEVVLYVNGLQNGKMKWEEGDSKGKGYYRSSYIPQIGDKIRVIASAEGLGEASAESFVPEPVVITKVTTSVKNVGNIDFPNNKLKMNITFRDDPNQKNYYLINFDYRIAEIDRELGGYTGKFVWKSMFANYMEEPLFLSDLSALESILGYDWLDYVYGRVFTDDLINGKEYTLQVLTELSYLYDYGINDEFYPVAEDDNNLRVNLYTISEDYYLYMKAVIDIADDGLYEELVNGGLAEPIPVFSNVTGGVGILGCCNVSRMAFTRKSQE